MGTFDDATFHLVDPRAPNEGTVARPGTVSWFYDCPPPSPSYLTTSFTSAIPSTEGAFQLGG
jgi:hypothetical protein